MNVTLVDDQGVELTEITSHLGRSSGQMLVDWATRPDALFQHYFDRGSRMVRVVIGAAEWSAVLGTRWQMGTRRWFLDEFLPVSAPDYLTKQAPAAALLPGTGTDDIRAVPASADLAATAVVSAYEPRGVPT